MAGKRPDQHNIDPAEAGATDHKNFPQSGQGNANLDDTMNRDHERLAQSRTRIKGNQPFLPDVSSPSAEANRAAHRQQIEAEEESDLEEEKPSS